MRVERPMPRLQGMAHTDIHTWARAAVAALVMRCAQWAALEMRSEAQRLIDLAERLAKG